MLWSTDPKEPQDQDPWDPLRRPGLALIPVNSKSLPPEDTIAGACMVTYTLKDWPHPDAIWKGHPQPDFSVSVWLNRGVSMPQTS